MNTNTIGESVEGKEGGIWMVGVEETRLHYIPNTSGHDGGIVQWEGTTLLLDLEQ